ncbi:MAG: NnrS family protein [Betaproteobacteria bacterium]|nr:NnrS family protein [Betaproteobacteria bacterium]MDH3436353.1 NnrS family protein [Betaproteobacteria bacterium]
MNVPVVPPPAPRKPSKPARFAVLALGFRPFYLLAGAFGALSIGLWAAQFSAHVPAAYLLEGSHWHAHEMLFGYAFAVMTGFLFTAVRNWTQLPTPTGVPLALLAAVWLGGRVLALTSWREWAMLTDTLFALGVAAGIGRPLIGSGLSRNFFFVFLVLALGAANLAFYTALLGTAPFSPAQALAVGLDIVLFIIAVIAGRVVPMFTNNTVPGAGARRMRAVEVAALGTVLVLLAADLYGHAQLAAVVAAAGALAHGARLVLWSPFRARRNPLLWILHASYAWIVVHLALRAAAGFDWITPGLATHALTIGAIGGMTLGMMTRTALGHTGRALAAGRAETASYVLIQLAAAARVLLPIAWPAVYLAATGVSGVLWSLAFAIFTVAYWPILTRPRVDGRVG